jgi:hypothetical protein
LAGVHVVPAAHARQLPPLQTFPAPQAWPSGAFPDSAHSGAPVLQLSVPTRQGFVTAQEPPTLQATQPVAPHTMSAPQLVPAATSVTWSVQTGLPALQSSLPVWQAFVGAHGAPVTQATHAPLEQAMFVPQDFPSATLPDCMQTARPVAHEVVPVWHGSPAGAQSEPSAQAPHAPAWQTIPVPHGVPSPWDIVVSTHDAPPEASQTVLPRWHGLPGMQAVSGTQAGLPTSGGVPTSVAVSGPASEARSLAVSPWPPAPSVAASAFNFNQHFLLARSQ